MTAHPPPAPAGTSPRALRRRLTPAWVFALAIGSEVGWGAFVLPFDWLQGAGLAGVVLGFGVATVLILVVGLVYATAIRALPRTGGGEPPPSFGPDVL